MLSGIIFQHENLISSDEKIFPWLLANFSEFFAGGKFKNDMKLATQENYARYEFLKPRSCRNYAIGEVTLRHFYELMAPTFIDLGHPIEVKYQRKIIFLRGYSQITSPPISKQI